MMALVFLLAVDSGMDLLQTGASTVGKSTRMAFRDVLIILGALMVLTLIMVLWAKFWRRSSRHHHRRRPHHHHQREAEPLEEPAAEETANADAETEAPDVDAPTGRRHRHRHRRRRIQRREHRPRNPTLAETGGLPPVRSPDTPPPGP